MAKIPIFDGHNDTLTRIFEPAKGELYSIFERNESGQLDLPRARDGGMAGGFFSIFTPPPDGSPERDQAYGARLSKNGYDVMPRSAIDPDYAREFTDAIWDYAEKISSDSKLRIVRQYSDLENCISGDYMAIIMHIEGAEAIDSRFRRLEEYYNRGLRSLGLVWSRPNIFGEGVPYRYPSNSDTGPGLTGDGRRLVGACNEMGIMIDLAHLNERGFRDVQKLSNRPLVVTHAAVHAICPSSRNISDYEIDAIADSGGVLGIFFEPINIKLQMARDGGFANDVALNEIIRHFDYIVHRVGADFVVIGSDFDGADMPGELRDVSCLPKLLKAFSEKGYSRGDIEKIAYKNWLRVLRETLN
jgi:membrane dipeptidase